MKSVTDTCRTLSVYRYLYVESQGKVKMDVVVFEKMKAKIFQNL